VKQLLWRGLALLAGFAALSLGGCSGSDGGRIPPIPPGHRVWTILVYFDADNNLEPALIKDFNELETVGTTEHVTIVAQMDRTNGYDTSNNDWTGTRRYLVTKDPDGLNKTIVSELLEDLGEKNMGDGQTLQEFIDWGMENYPADHYFLILSNHGAGWLPRAPALTPGRGVCFDDTNGNDFLSNRELKDVLSHMMQQRGGKKLELLGFDASEMSIFEVIYEIREYVDYVIASQLSEPNDGYPYDMFLPDFVADPTQNIEQFAQRFVQQYVDSYLPGADTNGAGSSVTQAVYRCSALEPLATAIDGLAKQLIAKRNAYKEEISDTRRDTQSFTETIYKDIYDFASLLKSRMDDADIQKAADAVMAAVGPGDDKALVAEGHLTGTDINVDSAHGIAIYLPTPSQYRSVYEDVMSFAQDTEWPQFIRE